jgi:hypothetical protein
MPVGQRKSKEAEMNRRDVWRYELMIVGSATTMIRSDPYWYAGTRT